MKQAHGNWVEGDRFWNREQDVELLMERIREGEHTLLVAQRRMGKTSLLHEVARRLNGEYVCLFVDLQKHASGADAVVELSLATHPHKPLWLKSTELFSNVFGKVKDAVEEIEAGELSVKLRAGLTAGDWRDKGDQLFRILAASEKPVLILLDEVPLLVNRILKDDDGRIKPNGRAQADEFMSWLRDNSIRHKGKVRIILSGSIGLEPVLNQAGLSATLSTFVPLDLKPWDESTAIGCLDALAIEYEVQFHEGATQAMVRMLGCCIPHHVQMFFTHVYDMCKRRGRMEFFPDEVEEVYHREMLGVRGHAELTHYEERLKLVIGAEYLPLAIEMLTEAAVAGALRKEALVALQKTYAFGEKNLADVQRAILQVLEHDGYLQREGAAWVFVSKLVRDWWKRRYEAFYTPVLERGV